MNVESIALTAVRAGAMALCLLAAGAFVARAEIPGYPSTVEGYDSREVALLPAYCKHTQLFRTHVPGGNNQDEISRWSAQMGPAFQAMHHYCWGLMKTNRAMLLAKSPQDRQFYLSSSIGEFDYVLERAQPGFVLLPEIYTRKGENLIRLGRSGPAIEALEKAIELKADYWPPYAHLSDFYKSTGNTAKARDILGKGLALVPDAKGLRRRLAELKSAGGRR